MKYLLLESQEHHIVSEILLLKPCQSLSETYSSFGRVVGSTMVLHRRAADEVRQIWTIIFGLLKKPFPVDLFPSYLLKLYEKKRRRGERNNEHLLEKPLLELVPRSNNRSNPCRKCLPTSHFTFSRVRNPRRPWCHIVTEACGK